MEEFARPSPARAGWWHQDPCWVQEYGVNARDPLSGIGTCRYMPQQFIRPQIGMRLTDHPRIRHDEMHVNAVHRQVYCGLTKAIECSINNIVYKRSASRSKYSKPASSQLRGVNKPSHTLFCLPHVERTLAPSASFLQISPVLSRNGAEEVVADRSRYCDLVSRRVGPVCLEAFCAEQDEVDEMPGVLEPRRGSSPVGCSFVADLALHELAKSSTADLCGWAGLPEIREESCGTRNEARCLLSLAKVPDLIVVVLAKVPDKQAGHSPRVAHVWSCATENFHPRTATAQGKPECLELVDGNRRPSRTWIDRWWFHAVLSSGGGYQSGSSVESRERNGAVNLAGSDDSGNTDH